MTDSTGTDVAPETSPATVKWLWLVAAVLVWPAVVQFVAAVVALMFVIPWLTGLGDALVLTAVAYALCRVARSLGAPPTLWVSVAIGSVPLLVLAVFAGLLLFADADMPLLDAITAIVGALATVLGSTVGAIVGCRLPRNAAHQGT
jgi:hypothetical protein